MEKDSLHKDESLNKSSNEGIKVIGAGLFRCGTFSLKHALEHLGYNKCYHMFEFFERPQDEVYWNDLVDNKDADFDSLFKGFAACVDIPSVEFIEKIFAKYPNAKVILNTRNPETWYESSYETVFKQIPEWLKAFPHIVKVSQWMVSERYKNKVLDKEFMIDYFKSHQERVRKLVPKDQLLEYEVKEGWKPICDFLGHEVPEIKFPHLNDRESMLEKLSKAKEKSS